MTIITLIILQYTGMFSANGHTSNQPLGPQQMGFHNPGRIFHLKLFYF